MRRLAIVMAALVALQSPAVPDYVQDRFAAFYDATFGKQVAKSGASAVFVEYAWPMAPGVALCDPCSSIPLRPEETSELGAGPQAAPLFLTRLHVRYDNAHFPEDLQFQETPDREQFQARYVMRVAVKTRSVITCSAGRRYRDVLAKRWRQENANLATLTGWNPDDIRAAMVEHWNRTRED